MTTQWLLVFLIPIASACRCAPLASCVVYSNGSWGCVCPFFGDGYTVCEEQRFVTDVVVRSRSEITPWLNLLSGATVGHMSQRRLLSETQYVLELDSTNYEAMVQLTEQINRKGWTYQIALLGSATSRVVAGVEAEDEPPLMEVLNISFRNGTWELELAVGGGMVFLSADVVPLPCVHIHSECCAKDYAFFPFRVGKLDAAVALNCTLPNTNASQQLGRYGGLLSELQVAEDGSVLLKISESELDILGSSDADYANFSVGVVQGGNLPAATQVQVSLRKNHTYSGFRVGTFQRQVAPFVMMQVERVQGTHYIRCWAQITLPNATVAFVQYAWGDMDWIAPHCITTAVVPNSCFQVPTPCQGSFSQNQMMELWVPIHNHALDRGNISLYFVMQSNQTLARVMTQSKPDVAVHHCTEIALSEATDVQVLQGLQLRQIYRGAVLPHIQLNVEPQTDTLITVVARSTRGATVEQLKAVHTRTSEERDQVESGRECATCVTEQLVLNGIVTSPRSCFLFGAGDPSTWIQNYVGLVGSTLALDVLARIPLDVKSGTAAAAWINPVWPYATDEEIAATTYLYAKFGKPKVQGPAIRRLLGLSSQPKLRAQWLTVAAAAVFILLWCLYQTQTLH